ncbi:MAG TPA: beta-N-acetylhexosaminidase [Bacteroidia bacterium]|nr:beta-N-acetylhexosaminidase [Bacteroidia bacterium]
MKKILSLLILSFIISKSLLAQIQLIPYPVNVELMHGSFKLDKNTNVVLVDDVLKINQIEIELFNAWLLQHYGYKLNQINTLKDIQNCIQIRSENKESSKYELNIQGNKIAIKASGEGLKNAFETLKQLMFHNANANQFDIQSCFIIDSARFQWRGMHLDVCRHFFDKAFIKKYIDYISMHKMNVFHWHLTDDQGWRIEIKKYPKLTEIGSKRKGSMIGHYNQHQFDTIAYGGYYTQEDIKEIVAYAKLKHVTIVPEIEMPGHAVAALAAYPQFACNKGPFNVEKQWGVFEDVFCPKPETFDFLEDVLSEVISLFPSEYIHVGGDECPKERWKKCANCQALIKSENLKDEHELQSYFIQRIEKFLNKHNKKLIGWDEILEGGLAPNAAVMSWRGIEGGIAAAKQKHAVVMTPGSHCYFDHYQGHSSIEPLAIGGFTPLEKVYEYDPIPSVLNQNEIKYILGAQANVWTEYITSAKAVEYAAIPRMAALAEVLWTPLENKSLKRFLNSVQKHLNYLDLYNTNYSSSIFNINYEIKQDSLSKQFYLNLMNVLFKNNALNTTDSIVIWNENNQTVNYTKPILLNQSFNGKAQFKRDKLLLGKAIPIAFNYHKAVGKEITFKEPPSIYYNKGNVTDGQIAHFPRINNEWLAWSGQNMEALIDLKSELYFEQVNIGFLKNESDWIYLPSDVEIHSSTDQIHFVKIDAKATIIENNGRFNYSYELKKLNARYLKIVAKCAPKIEEGRPGTGENAWLFIDEIEIK